MILFMSLLYLSYFPEYIYSIAGTASLHIDLEVKVPLVCYLVKPK